MSFQNEEGLPLVENKEEMTKQSVHSKALVAVGCVAVLATTAYASYDYGLQSRTTPTTINLSTKSKQANTSMKLNKKTAEAFSGVHVPLPNDANGPSTNDDAHKSITHHGFEKYDYMKDKVMSGAFSSYGFGMAQDGSPIPDNGDFEGGKGSVNIKVDFFDGIFKEYYHKGEKHTEKLGTMTGINKDDNIVFTDGDELERDGHKGNIFGSLQVTCGYEEHIADYHVHSGFDHRITVHSPLACPADMDAPYVCDYEGSWYGDDDQEADEYGVNWECKCDGPTEMCKCHHVKEGTSGEDMSWCAEWMPIGAVHSYGQDDDHEEGPSCTSAADCHGVGFCNFDEGDHGTCEFCDDFHEAEECHHDGLPDAGVHDCETACVGKWGGHDDHDDDDNHHWDDHDDDNDDDQNHHRDVDMPFDFAAKKTSTSKQHALKILAKRQAQNKKAQVTLRKYKNKH